jgi:hypothetical protein
MYMFAALVLLTALAVGATAAAVVVINNLTSSTQ